MSTVKTNAILDASGGNTATINSMTPTADSLQGFRNRIINGDMRIDQRNAGASVTPTTNNTYTLDRWTAFLSQASKYSVQQSTTTTTGFSNSLLATSLSAYTVGASEHFSIIQSIEGNNMSDLAWGTANAKTVTLSFWVRSSLTGTFGGVLNAYNGGANYPFSYTISAANTWEQKSITITGPTIGTWSTNNTGSIVVAFCLGAGSTLSGTAGVWSSTLYRSATGAVSVVGTNGATWYMTGAQLEVGSVATPFERRDYGRELMMCQRYYYKINADVNFGIFGVGQCSTTTSAESLITFPVPMRASPSALEQTGTASNYRIAHSDTGTACNGVPNFSAATNTRGANVTASVASGLTQGRACYLQSNNNTSAYLAWSAEL